MSSSRRWASSGVDMAAGRSPALPAAALSPVRHSARRSVVPSDRAPGAGSHAGRPLWPSSSSTKNSSSKKAWPVPSPLSSASPSAAAAAAAPSTTVSLSTLGDHLTNDAVDREATVAPSPQLWLSRQRSCTELPRFADADAVAEERKIGRSFGKGGHTFGRSMRFLPSSTKPAAVTLTPGRVAPSDLRRLSGSLQDTRADVASSGSECSDASRGSITRTIPKPNSPLISRTSSVRLLGSSNSQWALSPGRRSSSPLKTLAAVPESKGKKSLLSMGWGHLFNRKKTAADPTTTAATLSSLTVSRGIGAGGGEAGHHMRMMHCRFLQWRFINAKADAACKNKQAIAEVQLMGTWVSTSELRGKVARKQVQLNKEKLKMKLKGILSYQMIDLEKWGQLESKHAIALDTTVECARAAVCRIPLTHGAKVSLPSMASILEQMFELAMTAKISVRSFTPKAQATALLISELVRVASEERALLQECVELLGRVSALQIEEQSLRCHRVQLSTVTNLAAVE